MAHGHFGGMQVACLLWQRVCSEKFPSRTSLSGGFGKEAFLCVPLLLGSKRAVSPKCGHEPFIESNDTEPCERSGCKPALACPRLRSILKSGSQRSGPADLRRRRRTIPPVVCTAPRSRFRRSLETRLAPLPSGSSLDASGSATESLCLSDQFARRLE